MPERVFNTFDSPGWRAPWYLTAGASILGLCLLLVPRFISPQQAAFVLKSLGWILIGIAILFLFRQVRARWISGPAEKRGRRIEALHAELRKLLARKDAEPELDEVIQQKFDRLRELQKEEAAEMRRRFEAVWKPDEARKTREEARRFLAQYEDPPATDSTALRQG